VRDGGVGAREDGLRVDAGLVTVRNRGELHIAAGRYQDRIEAPFDGLIARAQRADEHIIARARLLDRAAEGEVPAHVELDLSVGVV
jgi:hypothetical protein